MTPSEEDFIEDPIIINEYLREVGKINEKEYYEELGNPLEDETLPPTSEDEIYLVGSFNNWFPVRMRTLGEILKENADYT